MLLFLAKWSNYVESAERHNFVQLLRAPQPAQASCAASVGLSTCTACVERQVRSGLLKVRLVTTRLVRGQSPRVNLHPGIPGTVLLRADMQMTVADLCMNVWPLQHCSLDLCMRVCHDSTGLWHISNKSLSPMARIVVLQSLTMSRVLSCPLCSYFPAGDGGIRTLQWRISLA